MSPAAGNNSQNHQLYSARVSTTVERCCSLAYCRTTSHILLVDLSLVHTHRSSDAFLRTRGCRHLLMLISVTRSTRVGYSLALLFVSFSFNRVRYFSLWTGPFALRH